MEEWIDYAARLSKPLSEALPTGEDPRYIDEFSLLKAEVEKKSDVDFERIRELSESILQEKSKDLRVASYLVMALSRLQGFTGLAQGMLVISHLVETHGATLHPVKPRGRQSAVKWFQQEKVLTFAQAQTESVSHEEAEFALNLYKTVFDQMSSLCEEPMSWPDLKKWLDQKKQETAPAEPDKPKEALKSTSPSVQSSMPGNAGPSTSSAAIATIESSSQYTQSVRQLINYFREQKHYGKMVGVALSCQWANLKLPPNEQGKTRLPVPRAASLARIRNAMDNDQWEEGLIACLDAFMEPSGQFLLDIPKWLFDCSKNSGNQEVMTLVQLHVSALVNRLPKIVQMKFDNDDAFVSSSVAAWIEQINQQSSNSKSESSENSLQQYLEQAREVLQAQNIQEAFKALDKMPQSNQLEQAYVEFCKAQLCVEQERGELALPILLQLEKVVDRLSLAKVMPTFAMQVWRVLYRLLQDQLSTIEQEQQKVEMETHIARLQSLMCTTDVASAMQWL